MTEKRRRRHEPIWFTKGSSPDFPNALCVGFPEPLWDFDIHKEPEAEQRSRHQRAMMLCRKCVYKAECRQWAEDHDEIGVWGGKVFVPIRSKFIPDEDDDDLN